ncbi:UNVERIFIED_CONTAM: putative aspartic proteinase GIP2 [Sesamum latifolium]|uniref:Aspartic proteinase GIP2 n=1 Tax=Sesamum latifolium TaxID=2727402 RepID=A0AAW2XUK9_9LAMI
MAASVEFFLLFSLIVLVSGSVSQNPILPKAGIVPVAKDFSTLQYVADVFMVKILRPSSLWWISMALLFGLTVRPGGGAVYNSKTCTLQAENTIARMSTSVELKEDRMAIEFWDGTGSGSFAKSEQFLFSCAPNLLLKGLAHGAKGMLGLGNSRISFPSQFSSTFGFFQRKFSLCLSPSDGAVFLGGNPFGSEISSSMMYTPLISKKDGLQEGYYMNVKSIKISGKKLSLHQVGLLSTKISTVVPYTTMESKIYGTFVEAYVKAATSMNLTLVTPVAPFEICFSSKGVENQRIGPNVPIIDLVLQSEMVKWRIYGRNSMVPVSDEVMCLGFLDGGLSPKDSIVIGGYQIEDYLLEFNLGNSMLGFSSSLLTGQKGCSDFEASVMSREIF